MQRYFSLIVIFACFAFACSGEKKSEPSENAAPQAAKEVTSPKSATAQKVLLVTQSEFKTDKDGAYTIPDVAVMLVVTPGDTRWKVERIEDRDSNVFHKALYYPGQGILTLGGNQAFLKLWTKQGSTWQSKTLWNPKFGGKNDRLRDFEIADFDGDGEGDLAIATHDQGVVAIVFHRDDKWEPVEIDRRADTIVHEIEIGDLNGDGQKEIYATPSQPNTVSGKDQGGKVVQFSYEGGKFTRTEVVSLATRHIKEILVADLDSDGRQELYAALEAEVDGANILKPVEIRRFDYENGTFKEKTVVSINDRYCRFLVAGDIDQDGRKELVATAFSTGIWVIEQEGTEYKKTCIDAASGGFEHASYITDIDGDGKDELYVADDRSGALRRYDFLNETYNSKVLIRRPVPSQAMVWNITAAEL